MILNHWFIKPNLNRKQQTVLTYLLVSCLCCHVAKHKNLTWLEEIRYDRMRQLQIQHSKAANRNYIENFVLYLSTYFLFDNNTYQSIFSQFFASRYVKLRVSIMFYRLKINLLTSSPRIQFQSLRELCWFIIFIWWWETSKNTFHAIRSCRVRWHCQQNEWATWSNSILQTRPTVVYV